MRQFARLIALQLLRSYKWAVSPFFPPSCRYVPTCSEYAMEAVDRFGVLRGTAMAIGRLLRCHPLAKGGYDPVVKPLRVVVQFDCHPEQASFAQRGACPEAKAEGTWASRALRRVF